MKILLLLPRLISGAGRFYEFPIGLAYVSAALKQAGHDVACVNLNHDPRPDDAVVAEAVRTHDPDMCGSGTLSSLLTTAKVCLDAARRAKPSIINVAGGGMVSSAPDIAAHVVDLDYGVIGEGEETVVELADALERGADPSGVAGLVMRGGRLTPERPPIRDLDALAWPDYEGFGIEEYLARQSSAEYWFFQSVAEPRSIPMVSSRSCPFRCTFCFHPSGSCYRRRTLDGFFAELDHLVGRFGINMLNLQDELFSLQKDRILEFCERIAPYGLKWVVSLHFKVVDGEVLDAMKAAGCHHVGLGVESASDTILASMRKRTTRAQIERGLERIYDRRMGIQGNLIFGDEAETVETANETLHWWARNRRYQLNLMRLSVLPGSTLFDRAVGGADIEKRVDLLWHPGRNVTGMDDRTYHTMIRRITAFNESLLLPARVLRFDPCAGSDEHYDVEWECPRCGHVNAFPHRSVHKQIEFQNLRMVCRECHSRFDVQNLARRPFAHPDADAGLERADALRAAAKPGEAAAIYRRIVAEVDERRGYERPRAMVEAARALAMMTLEFGGDATEAANLMADVMIQRAYDPSCHADTARAYIAEGSFGAARAHLEQVLMLVPSANDAQVSSRGGVEALLAALPEPAPGTGYVI